VSTSAGAPLTVCALAALLVLAGCNEKAKWLGADYPALAVDAAVDGAVDAALPPEDGGQIDPVLLPPGAPNDGIFLYWLFDSDELSVAEDASGNGRHGTLENAPSLSEPAPGARANNLRGRFFNGTGELARYQGDALPPAFTMALWVKPAESTLAAMLARAGGDSALELVVSETGHFEVRTAGQPAEGPCEPATACVSSTSTLVKDAWHHLALTVDGAGLVRLFVNGQEEASMQAEAVAAASAALELAVSAESARPGLRGVLDEVIVYDRALAAEHIRRLSALR
jgi:hypothetical protein